MNGMNVQVAYSVADRRVGQLTSFVKTVSRQSAMAGEYFVPGRCKVANSETGSCCSEWVACENEYRGLRLDAGELLEDLGDQLLRLLVGLHVVLLGDRLQLRAGQKRQRLLRPLLRHRF